MKSENKKYLVYGGLALIAGGIGYVAYALIFPKKYKDDATVKLKTENETPTQSNPFKDMLDNPVIPSGIDWKFNLNDFGYNPNRTPFTTKSVLL